MKKIVSCFLCVIMLLCSIKVNIYAAQQDSFSVQSVTINSKTFDAYVYSDPLIMPDTPQIYFPLNGKVQHCAYKDFCALMLNKSLGLAVSNNILLGFMSYCLSAETFVISALDGTVCKFVVNNGSIIGMAIGNLSGLPLYDDTTYQNVPVSSDVSNFYYNCFNKYISDNPNLTSPDFINIPTYTGNLSKLALNASSSIYHGLELYIDNPTNKYNFGWYYMDNVRPYDAINQSSYSFIGSSDIGYAISAGSQGYEDIIDFFGVNDKQNYIKFSDWLDYGWGYNSYSLDVYFYDSNNTQITTFNRVEFIESWNVQNDVYYREETYPYSYSISIFNGRVIPFSNIGYITVYKSNQVVTQIINNTYSKQVYTSNIYNNYNTQSDNSTSINNTEINNAETNNTTIYNESKSTTNNNIQNNNYSYDYSVNDNSVTNIINNYYYGSSSDPENPDDDDSHWWDSIVDALGGFFTGLGRIIAEIISGIISIFNSVLDMIANIQVDISGLQTFLSSIFGFLPSELVSIIVAGVGLMIIICIIKALK